MAKRNKPFPLSLIIIAVLLLIIYFMNDGTWGTGTNGNNTGEKENVLKDKDTLTQQTPDSNNQIVFEKAVNV